MAGWSRKIRELLDALGIAGTTDGEVYVTTTIQESSRWVVYSALAIGADKGVVLIDLSDIQNWPHKDTGRVDVTAISMKIDRAANSSGSVSIGLITRIDATNADVAVFSGMNFNNSADTSIVIIESFPPQQIRCKVLNGRPVDFLGPIVTTTLFQNDQLNDSALGVANVIPAIGDVVALIDYVSGGAFNIGVGMHYHSQV